MLHTRYSAGNLEFRPIVEESVVGSDQTVRIELYLSRMNLFFMASSIVAL